MVNSVISMIESAAVIVLGVLFLAGLGDRLRSRPLRRMLVTGVVFGLLGMLSMLSPVEFEPGLRVDARNVVIALAASVAGPVGAFTSAVIIALTRIYFGGGGMIGGIVSILLVATGASALWMWLRANGKPLDIINLSGYAAVTALAAVVTVPIFVSKGDVGLLVDILMFLVPANVLGTLVAGLLMIRERERQWAFASLKDEQARLQAIAKNAPGVLFQLLMADDGRVQLSFVSAGAERILGASPESLTADPDAIRRHLSDQTMDELRALLASSAETGQSWQKEMEFTRPDGSSFWVRAAGEPRRDISGRQVWDGSLFDISEQRLSAQLKDEFISTVSHELRTPLTSIRGALGLVSAGTAGPLPAKAETLISIAHKNSERLVLLVNDILDIEKIEAGRIPFDMAPQLLTPTVEGAIETSKDYLADKGVEIRFRDGADGAMVFIDPDRLHQVLTNLLSNAIKFSPDGGIVTVATERADGMARITVSDQGPGIPEAFHSRIFGRFAQAASPDTRSVGGTGLGLSIAKAIVERLDGTISFETAPERGTTFTVDLPELEYHAPEGEPEQSVTHDIPTPRVLVVEDEEDAGALICLDLAADGIVCDVARDIGTAKAFLAANSYIAMTLDLRLADESGVMLLRDMRECGHDIPVIVVAAKVDPTRQELNGSALGILDWIEKTHDMDRLRAAVMKARRFTGDTARVLHVEDNEDIQDIVRQGLNNISVTTAGTIAEATVLLTEDTYDVVILDLELPDGSGADLIDMIPEETAVVIFSAHEVEEKLARRVRAAFRKSKETEVVLSRMVRRLTTAPDSVKHVANDFAEAGIRRL